MMNQVVLVGRITKIKKTEDGCYITVAVLRHFKNKNGEYETDFIRCTLLGGISENTMEYCRQGDVIGIKGRVQSDSSKIEIIAEKVTFLSSKKEDSDEKEV